MLYGLGGLILVLGIFYKLYPPKSVNYFYGHKTKLSMKNQDTWDVAQKIGAFSMMVAGLLMVALGYLFYNLLHVNDATNRPVIVAVVVIVMACMIAFNEIYLRKIFNSEGKRK